MTNSLWAFTCRGFRRMRSTCFRFFRRVLISGAVRSSFVLVMLIHFCVYHLCACYPIRRSFLLSLLLLLCHPKLITNRILTYLRQATLYKMAQRIIAENAHIQAVTYTLPNKHYIPVDMRYIGVDNLTPLSVLPLLLSLFSHVLCLIVIFLLIVMDDSGRYMLRKTLSCFDVIFSSGPNCS